MKSTQRKLLRCAEDGDTAGVTEALEHGAQVNQPEVTNTSSRSGRTALHYATREGHLYVVRLLIQWDADVNIRSWRPGDDGAAPLHMAAYAGHVEVMKSLLEGGADGEAKDGKGKTAVHWAALQGQLDPLKLLKNYRCDLNAKVERKANALHFAVASGDLEVVAWLLKQGVRSDLKDKDKRLPLDLAKRLGHTDIHLFLKTAGSLRYKLSLFNKSSFRSQPQVGGSRKALQRPDNQDSEAATGASWRDDATSGLSRWGIHFRAPGKQRKGFPQTDGEAEAGPSGESRLAGQPPTDMTRLEEVLKQEAGDVRILQEGGQSRPRESDTGALDIACLSRQLDHTIKLLLQTNHRLDQTIQDLELTKQRLRQSIQLLEQVNHKLEVTNQQLELTEQQLDLTNQQMNQTNQQLEQTNQRLEVTEQYLNQTNQQLTAHGGKQPRLGFNGASQEKLSAFDNNREQLTAFDNNREQLSAFDNNREQLSAFDNNREQLSTFDNNREQLSAFDNNREQLSAFDNNREQLSAFDNNREQLSMFDNNREQLSMFDNNHQRNPSEVHKTATDDCEVAPICGVPQQVAPICGVPQQVAPFCDVPQQVPPICGVPQQVAPICDVPQQVAPICGVPQQVAPICGVPQQVAPFCDVPQQVPPICGVPQQVAPICVVPQQVASPSGLPNLGNTCYINSVVQCLFNINSFRDYFIRDTYRFQINRESEHHGEVAHTLASTLKALHSGHHANIRAAAKVLQHVVGVEEKEFQGSQQHDAHDLLAALLTWLHNDLMQADLSSVVSELFHGEEKSVITCEEREEETVISSICQPFSSVTLAVNHTHPCDLQTLLTSHYKTQRIEWECETCGRSHLCRHEIRVVHFPPLLVIHLSRYNAKNSYTSKTKVMFPAEGLSLQGHKAPSPRYKVCGVVVHHGTMTAGHYVAFCRSHDNSSSTWQLYDDDVVSNTDLNAVLAQTEAHLLFFRAMK